MRILVFVSLLLFAFTAHADVTNGLVGWWKFDEGSGTTAADSASRFGATAHDGTLTNGPTWTTGPRGGALNFDAIDDYVTNAAFSWAGGSITIAFWNYSTGGTNGTVFTIGNLNSPNRIMAHATWGDNVLYWDYGNASGPGRIFTDYASYLNKWTHIVLVNNGVDFKAIYLDGRLITSGTTVDSAPGGLTGIWIGTWAGYFHNGRIDDFRVYNRVLSAGEIQDIYQGGSENFGGE